MLQANRNTRKQVKEIQGGGNGTAYLTSSESKGESETREKLNMVVKELSRKEERRQKRKTLGEGDGTDIEADRRGRKKYNAMNERKRVTGKMVSVEGGDKCSEKVTGKKGMGVVICRGICAPRCPSQQATQSSHPGVVLGPATIHTEAQSYNFDIRHMRF